ncbi:MAG: sigma factor-like helix-turn-helix DNA-binding protein [Bacillota bacterium]
MAGGKVEEQSSPEKVHRLSVLRDLYEGLLPPRQREVIAMRLDEDLSLAEMAERLGVSRQACEDALKRGERALLETEEQLSIGKRLSHEGKCVSEAVSSLCEMTGDNWQGTRDLALKWLKAFKEGGETDSGV